VTHGIHSFMTQCATLGFFFSKNWSIKNSLEICVMFEM